MSRKHEQLKIEGFDESMPSNSKIVETLGSINTQESRLMLTSLARQRLDQIIRGDVKDSKELDLLQNPLPNK